MKATPTTPLDLLLPYQARYVADKSRFKIWCAARQIGKSFAAAMEVSLDCLERPGQMWVILSAGERQALEMMEKVKQCLTAWGLTLAWEGIERDGVTQDLKSAEARLKNGSRVIALPANADTARGYSANLVLDEFAFHRDPAAIWRAIFPSVSNPLKGELRCRILSTPNGQGGQGSKFYELFSGDDAAWSRHRTTIHDAVGDGLKVDVDALRKAAGDADGFAQEYECAFIDTARTAFPYELIAACESAEASRDGTSPAQGPLYCGIDVGTINDPTCCVTLCRSGGRLVVTEVFSLKGMSLSDQDEILAPRIARAVSTSLDASGLGRDIAQRMARRFGGKFIGQTVTSAWKRQAFQRLRGAMIDRLLALPTATDLREDMHSYQVFGAGETETYRAPRTDEGHSDFTSALAHAYDAAKQDTGFFMPKALTFKMNRNL